MLVNSWVILSLKWAVLSSLGILWGKGKEKEWFKILKGSGYKCQDMVTMDEHWQQIFREWGKRKNTYGK